MSNAREIVTLRNLLQQWLQPQELRVVAWPAIANASAPALDRGWTADELARWCIADLAGNPPDNVGAVLVTTLRTLATIDPPREHTPTPDPFDLDDLAKRRAQRAADPSGWAARIRRPDGTATP